MPKKILPPRKSEIASRHSPTVNESGYIEYGQTSYAPTETAIANLEEMLDKIKSGLMLTCPRIKCTLRIEVESQS